MRSNLYPLFCPIARHICLELPFIVYSILKQCWSVGYVSLLTLSFIAILPTVKNCYCDRDVQEVNIIFTFKVKLIDIPQNLHWIHIWLCHNQTNLLVSTQALAVHAQPNKSIGKYSIQALAILTRDSSATETEMTEKLSVDPTPMHFTGTLAWFKILICHLWKEFQDCCILAFIHVLGT